MRITQVNIFMLVRNRLLAHAVPPGMNLKDRGERKFS